MMLKSNDIVDLAVCLGMVADLNALTSTALDGLPGTPDQRLAGNILRGGCASGCPLS
jgi:hypothetical protein